MMPSRPERQSLRAPLRDATLRRSYLIRVFGLIWTAARGWTVAWGILLVVQGLMPVALVYLTKPLVDGLQAAVGRGTSWETVRPVLLVVVGIGGVLLLTELLKVCLEWIGTAQSELVQDHITDLVHAKSTAVDLAFYETPDFYDHLYRARGDAGNRPLALLGAEGVALLVSAGTIAWMVARAFMGRATLGDIALFYQAFQRGQGLMRALLTNVGQIYTNGLFLANLFEFLDLEARIVDPPQPLPTPSRLRHGIRFRDVTFRYPGTDRVALRKFHLMIPAGQTVAIVGANGAGKTTLLKLLCRFYDPEAGHVELDGIDLRDLSLAQLRRMVTVMFQLPVSYQGTARHNIAMGDLAAEPDLSRIEAAARDVGAHTVIAALPKGYDTLLGKWFAEGTELSAGEWQRVALARAYLRQSQIMILDEPTSFMDSWAEAEWFERFRALAQGRTSILITHRLTIAMRADIIHVMQRGEIVESGTHQELLAQGGLYAQSWRAQVESAAHLSEMSPAHAGRS